MTVGSRASPLRRALLETRRAWLWLCLASVYGATQGALTLAAHAEASPYLGRENPLNALLPSAQALREREQQRLEAQLQRTLETLPDVKRAELVVTLPPVGAALDRVAPTLRARVLIEASPGAASDAEIIRGVRTVVPELAPEHVRILRPRGALRARPERAANSGAGADPRTATDTRVGPFLVAPESAAALRATLGTCLGANAVLAALLLARRRAR